MREDYQAYIKELLNKGCGPSRNLTEYGEASGISKTTMYRYYQGKIVRIPPFKVMQALADNADPSANLTAEELLKAFEAMMNARIQDRPTEVKKRAIKLIRNYGAEYLEEAVKREYEENIDSEDYEEPGITNIKIGTSENDFWDLEMSCEYGDASETWLFKMVFMDKIIEEELRDNIYAVTGAGMYDRRKEDWLYLVIATKRLLVDVYHDIEEKVAGKMSPVPFSILVVDVSTPDMREIPMYFKKKRMQIGE